jgi:hypothetical protein
MFNKARWLGDLTESPSREASLRNPETDTSRLLNLRDIARTPSGGF